MSDPPPPAPPGPPAGWYPDPQSGGRGFRWWDGATWTETWTEHPETRGEGLTPIGEWLNLLIRTVGSRAGHFLPMVVLLVVPATLLNGHSAWAAFRNGVVTSGDNGQLAFSNPEASTGWYAMVGLSVVLLMAAFVLLLVAAARQTNATLDEEPEVWSVSMRAALSRLPKAIGLSALLIGILLGLYLIVMASVSMVPVLVLVTIPLWLVGTVVVSVRFSLTNIAAALAPPEAGCLRTSMMLTRGHVRPLLGRMALLLMFSISLVLMMQIVATPFVAIGGGAGTTPIDLGGDEMKLIDVIGDNPAVFAIQQLFNGLAYGAAMVIWTVGFVLVYRDLSGPVEAAVTAEGSSS